MATWFTTTILQTSTSLRLTFHSSSIALKEIGKFCDRVRLQMAVPNSQKLIMAMDEEYPVLDHLVSVTSMEDKSTALILSDTLKAPHHHLHHLALRGISPLSHFVVLWTTHSPTSIQMANALLQ